MAGFRTPPLTAAWGATGGMKITSFDLSSRMSRSIEIEVCYHRAAAAQLKVPPGALYQGLAAGEQSVERRKGHAHDVHRKIYTYELLA
jgi:hypothetical protein